MRTILLISAASLALVACGGKTGQTGGGSPPAAGAPPAAASATAGPTSLPSRKAGLWTETMARDGKTAAMGQMRMCVDAATDAKLMGAAQHMGKTECQRQDVSRGLDGTYSTQSTCTLPMGGTMISKATIIGDMNSKYHVHVEGDVSGARFAPMNGHHVTEIDASYLGPCPADMTPGDIAMANGMKINIAKMGAGGPPGPAGGQ